MAEEVSQDLAEVQEIEAPAVAAPAVVATAEVVRVCAGINRFYNPFTKQHFPQGEEVEAVLDSWLECQLAAGYMSRV